MKAAAPIGPISPIPEISDKERLDWLERQSNGDYWVARQSITNRGFRLHNASAAEGCPNTKPTAREAIDAAMRARVSFLEHIKKAAQLELQKR